MFFVRLMLFVGSLAHSAATPDLHLVVEAEHSALPACAVGYAELRAEIGGGRVGAGLMMRERTSSTIKITGHRDGKHGGKIQLIERIGDTWGSFYSTKENSYFDPQGDPRLFIDAIGEEAAAYFGYKIIDGTHIEVPDYQE